MAVGESDLLTATVALAAGGVAGLVIFRRLGFGSVLGLLVVGMAIGPHGLGVLAGGEELRRVAEIGVVFLLYAIGLEMRPETLWAMRRLVFGLGGLQLALTTLALFPMGLLLGLAPPAAFVLAAGFALSSTALCIQLLEERGDLYTEWGRGSVAVLLFQDLAVVPLLALVPLLAGRLEVGAEFGLGLRLLEAGLAVGLVILAGTLLLPRLLDLVARERNMEAFTGLALLAALLAAWAVQRAGLSMGLGAFLMGLLLSRTRYHHQLEAEIAPFKGILLGLFFIAVGMSLDVERLLRDLPRLLPVLLALVLVKAGILHLLARLFGSRRGDAVRMALLLAQGGEFAFVLFGTALAFGILAPETYTPAVLLISLSMMATPLLARLADRLAARLEPSRPPAATPEARIADLDAHVVICGFGRIGGTVGLMLDALRIPFVAIDHDPKRVEEMRREGHPILFGDATDPRILKAAGTGRARLVLVTLDHPAVAERVVSTVHNFYPDIAIVARARDFAERERLLALGAREAIPEALELAFTLGSYVLRHMGVAEVDAVELVDRLHERAFEMLRARPALSKLDRPAASR